MWVFMAPPTIPRTDEIMQAMAGITIEYDDREVKSGAQPPRKRRTGPHPGHAQLRRSAGERRVAQLRAAALAAGPAVGQPVGGDDNPEACGTGVLAGADPPGHRPPGRQPHQPLRRELGAGGHTNLDGATTHQFGAKQGTFGRTTRGGPIPWGNIPARPFLGPSDDLNQDILEAIHLHMATVLRR